MEPPRIMTESFAVGHASIRIAKDAGPRILSYSNNGTHGPFADLPNDYIDHPGIDPFWFIGGHRLWRAPEFPSTTYAPDDNPVSVRTLDTGIQIVGQPDRDGVVKVIELAAFGDMTVVNHTLRNEGHGLVTTAVWAITQLAIGGVGVLPHDSHSVDGNDVLPNRTIVMWPYTNPNGPSLEFGERDVRIYASADSTKTKVGTQNTKGWVAYHLEDELFVKWSLLHDPTRVYPDLDSSIECYSDHRFIELETLGPIVDLDPGDAAHHREVWQLINVGRENLDEVLSTLPVQPEAMCA